LTGAGAYRHRAMDPVPASTVTPLRPVLSLAEAVAATGKSRNTLRRFLKAGEIEGATQLPGGSWAIPVEGLLAAGLPLHRPDRGHAPDAAPGSGPDQAGELGRLREEVTRLRVELASARTAAEERGRALEDLRVALRMLTGPARTAAPVNGPSADTPSYDRRKRWWSRNH
jgi:hypothetical protein